MKESDKKTLEDGLKKIDSVIDSIAIVDKRVMQNSARLEEISKSTESTNERISILNSILFKSRLEEGHYKLFSTAMSFGLACVSISIGLSALSFSLPDSHFSMISTWFAFLGIGCIIGAALAIRDSTQGLMKKKGV